MKLQFNKMKNNWNSLNLIGKLGSQLNSARASMKLPNAKTALFWERRELAFRSKGLSSQRLFAR